MLLKLNKNIFTYIKLLFQGKLPAVIVFLFLFLPAELYSQPDYKFNFDKNWEWVEFIYGGHDVSPSSKSMVEEIEQILDIKDARILFKNLSRLGEINNVKSLSEIALLDSMIIPNNFRQKINNAFMYFDAGNTLNGLIYAAYCLAPLCSNAPLSSKSFYTKEKPFNINDTLKINFYLNFDYKNAELILDLLGKKNIDHYNEIKTKLQEYADKLLLDKEKINLCFLYAADDSPLYNIYKLINPASFSNLGGVVLYKEQLDNAINKYKKNEDLITFEVKNKVFQLLPYEVSINTNVEFSLALEQDDKYEYSRTMALNIEPSGDDYHNIVKCITRRLFVKGRNQIYTNILPYISEGTDTMLVEIISEVHNGGILNYIAPLFQESRPLSLLEKDFLHFKKIIKELKYSTKEIVDSLFREGLAGIGMFYTMGTEMSFTLDRFAGRQVIKNSLILGPLYFFKSYIDTYKENEKIRSVFRFPADFEEKINSLLASFSNEIALEVFNISLKQAFYENDSDGWRTFLIGESGRLTKKYKNHYNSKLLNVFLADLFYKEGLYDESVKYFIRVISESKEKKRIFLKIYSLFEKKSRPDECILLSTEFIKLQPSYYPAYLLRGIMYYKTLNFAEAKQDFEIVLQYDAGNREAIDYFNKIENQ